MAPAKASMLSALIDVSDIEDTQNNSDIDMMPTPDSALENKAPPKRNARNAANKKGVTASKVAKTKAVSRRVSEGRAPATTKNATVKGRKALAEKNTNAPNDLEDGNETEEVDDFDEEPAKPIKKAKATKDAPAAKSRAKAAAAPKKAGRTKRVSDVPETRPEPMEIEPTEIAEDTIVSLPAEPVRKRQPVARAPLAPQLSSRARSSSRQPDPYARHRRAGSASDTERAGEPALRSKLGEVTRKFENLEMKYRNLKDLGGNEAQSNFDKLKKSTDQRARDQDEIIASLKKELAAQKALSTEGRSLRNQNATLQAENARLTSEAKSQSSTITSLQNEVKALQAKLSAARSNAIPEAQTNGRTVPGSAAKSRGNAKANVETENERLKVMQMKEDLYSDLTGLMIHAVKRGDEEDVFDCIQTGRNGTLRFHLSVGHPDAKAAVTATPGTTYDEEEFAYAPLLDEKNDQQLLEILPDYLTEEIVFPRPSAARFYQKVIDSMSKKFVDE